MPACDPVLKHKLDLKHKLRMLGRAAMRLKAKAVRLDIDVRKRRRAWRREAALGAGLARRLAEVEGEYIEALQAATEALSRRFQSEVTMVREITTFSGDVVVGARAPRVVRGVHVLEMAAKAA